METDSLANLEERISKAIQVISDLRAKNAALAQHAALLEEEVKGGVTGRQELQAQHDALLTERDQLAQTVKQQTQELEDIRGERKQVRARIEKLLSQLDLLSAT